MKTDADVAISNNNQQSQVLVAFVRCIFWIIIIDMKCAAGIQDQKLGTLLTFQLIRRRICKIEESYSRLYSSERKSPGSLEKMGKKKKQARGR